MSYTPEQTEFLRQKFPLVGRILFPNLLKLKKKKLESDREVYDVQFAFRPEDNAQTLAKIQQYMTHAIPLAHQGINPAALIPPIKDFNTYVKQNGQPNPEYLRGHLWVNASTGRERPPKVVKEVPGLGLVQLTSNDEAELWSGRNAVISIYFWPMVPKPGSQNQKRGFYVNVEAVLLKEGGDSVGGGASQIDVNQVFGSFVQDMGMAPQFGNPAAFNAPGAPAPLPAPVVGNGYAPGVGAPQTGGYAAPANPTLPPMTSPSNAPAWPPQNAAPATNAPAWGQPTNFNPNTGR